MQKFYVMRNAGQAVFVKDGDFFEQQKRQSAPNDTWWMAWTPVQAEGIEHARMIGERDLPMYKPKPATPVARTYDLVRAARDCRDCTYAAADPDGLFCSHDFSIKESCFGYGLEKARSLDCGTAGQYFVIATDTQLKARGRLPEI